MRLALGRQLIALGSALGLMLCFVEDISAGGGSFAPDENDAGPRFFGFVKDPDNDAR